MHVKKRSGGLISRGFGSGLALVEQHLVWNISCELHACETTHRPFLNGLLFQFALIGHQVWEPMSFSPLLKRHSLSTNCSCWKPNSVCMPKGEKRLDWDQYMHCLVLPQGADFNLQMFGFIVESAPLKKIKIKNPQSQFTFTFDVSVNFYLAGNNDSSSTRLLSDLRPRWAIHRTLSRFR